MGAEYFGASERNAPSRFEFSEAHYATAGGRKWNGGCEVVGFSAVKSLSVSQITRCADGLWAAIPENCVVVKVTWFGLEKIRLFGGVFLPYLSVIIRNKSVGDVACVAKKKN